MSGSVQNQAVYSMNVAQSWDVFKTQGAGVKIGVISDSFDYFGSQGREDDYARDVSTGDLPATVDVLEDSYAEGMKDEGRAMLQLIHDIAPEAQLAFHTGLGGIGSYITACQALAEAGCTIIVDDIGIPGSPYYMDSYQGLVVDELSLQGVMFFSAAGNDGLSGAYEASFAHSGEIGPNGGSLHDFDPGPGVDTTQSFTVDAESQITISLQWDQPFYTVTGGMAFSENDLNLHVYDQDGNLVAESCNANTGFDPLEMTELRNDTAEPRTFEIAVSLMQGEAPGRMRWMPEGQVTIDEYFNEDTPTVYGHCVAPASHCITAAPWYETPPYGVNPAVIESFASRGPATILFDSEGARLEEPEIRSAPLLTAPDACSNTFFGTPDSEHGYQFYGTSAAVPNAAAVAALMLAAAPFSIPLEIIEAMTTTTADMGAAGYDYDSGYGLIQADDALAYITQGADFSPVYEVSLGEASLWTDSRDEKLNVMSGQIWSYDGIGFGEAVGNDVIPTYRFYSAATNDHFLTTSASERDNVLATMSDLYAYEGESFSVYASEQEGSTELYRFCNPQNMLHVYTADVQEYNELLAQPQFNYEGVMGWVEPLMV